MSMELKVDGHPMQSCWDGAKNGMKSLDLAFITQVKEKCKWKIQGVYLEPGRCPLKLCVIYFIINVYVIRMQAVVKYRE